VLVVLAGLLGPVPRPAGAEDDDTAQEQYDEVVGQEAEALDRLAAARAARGGYQADALVLDGELQEAQARLGEAERRLADAGVTADLAEDELVEAEAEVTEAMDRLRRQAVDSYMFGDVSGSQAMLTSSVDESDRIRVYAGAVADHQQQLIDDLEDARIERDRLATEAEAAEAAAVRSRDEIAAVRLLVETQLQEKTRLADLAAAEEATEAVLLFDLQSRKVEIQTRITAMQRDSDGLALLIAAAQQGQPDWTPLSVVTVDPLPGAPMSSPFGIRFHPILQYQRLHTGQDLSAGTGTPIHAAADGTVLVASERGGYGNTTVIDHGSSLSTLYGHQSRILVTVGQTVRAGDVIGLVGSTGMSTGPHLHFETRVRGVPVDPTSFVVRL
jgi:murein DD-endopeptidase MepM/ murein hydrolase activator NlpD